MYFVLSCVATYKFEANDDTVQTHPFLILSCHYEGLCICFCAAYKFEENDFMVQRDNFIIFELPACFSHVIPEPEVDSGQTTELVCNINSIPDLFVPFACLHVYNRGISPSVIGSVATGGIYLWCY